LKLRHGVSLLCEFVREGWPSQQGVAVSVSVPTDVVPTLRGKTSPAEMRARIRRLTDESFDPVGELTSERSGVDRLLSFLPT